MTITRTTKELVALVAQKTKTPAYVCEATIRATADAIHDILIQREKVRVLGLGTFYTRDTKARMGRSPRTQEPVEIRARVTAGFTPTKQLKDL